MDIEKKSTNLPARFYYGASIILYRWMLNESEHQNLKNFDFMVWGYFDQMNIQCNIHSIRDFHFGKKASENIRFESQRMCIYTDDIEGINLLSPNLIVDNDHYPLIVITEIKLNIPNSLDTLLQMDYSNYYTYCERKINEILLQKSNVKPKILFHQFYSLGYSDLVIVFRGQSYYEIMNLLLCLRDITADDNNINNGKLKVSNTKIISSTYSITGVDLQQYLYVRQENVSLSVRISLKPGCDLNKAVCKISECLQLQKDKIRPVFGKYDLDVIFTTTDPRDYIKVCGINFDSILNPRSNEYHDYINYRNTRWIGNFDDMTLLPGSLLSQVINIYYDNKQPVKISAESDKTKELYYVCKFLEKSCVLPEPLFSAFWLLTKCYIQIMQNDVSDIILSREMEIILTYFISMFFWNLSLNDDEQKTIRKSGKLSRNIDRKQSTLDIKSFEKGIKIFNDVMQNRIHASRMIFEMPSYNQNIIDTSTDIAKVYSNIVSIVQNVLPILKNNHSGVDTVFFVTFNNTLEIETHSLFPLLSETSKKRLIGIHLNNTSLYDFKYSIPYIFHEIGHYIDPIKNGEINRAYHDCLCYIISQIIFGELFDSPTFGESTRRFNKPILRKSISEIIQSFKEEIINETTIEFDQNPKLFANTIKHHIWNYFHDISENKPKRKNIKKLLMKSSLFTACENFRIYIKNSDDTERAEDLITFFAKYDLLENRSSSLDNIQNKIVTYFSNDYFREDFNNIANYYFNLYGEIIADFVMIRMLGLDTRCYQDIINNYFIIHGSKHNRDDYLLESDIRRCVLVNSGIIRPKVRPKTADAKAIVDLLSPLSNILKLYDQSGEWVSIISHPTIKLIRELYINHIQNASNENSFSDEMKFILSLLKGFSR